MNTKRTNGRSFGWWFRIVGFAVLVVFLVSIWFGSWFFLKRVFSSDFPSMGQVGDSFGAVNALFSGLALAGVVMAILMQNWELKLQREDLELTRTELRGQKEELAAQRSVQEKQLFETKFFNMLRAQGDILNGVLSWSDPGGAERRGYRAFRDAREKFSEYLRGPKSLRGGEGITRSIDLLLKRFPAILTYFSFLENFLVFLDEQKGIEISTYVDIIRSAFSEDICYVMFFYCACSYGQENLKPMVEKHHLLGNVSRDIIEGKEYQGLLSPEAWGVGEKAGEAV